MRLLLVICVSACAMNRPMLEHPSCTAEERQGTGVEMYGLPHAFHCGDGDFFCSDTRDGKLRCATRPNDVGGAHLDCTRVDSKQSTSLICR